MLTSVRPQAWISDAANCIDSDDRRCAWKLAETLEAQVISEVAAIIPVVRFSTVPIYYVITCLIYSGEIFV